ncbi:hypothetical protein ABZ468_42675 [Streptomyces sp. NPDC005708]|uniref:hypothetical protein n=1 Tax=unclassified Streptomyces TaxID=2593676 RepID=UPI0033D3ED1E
MSISRAEAARFFLRAYWRTLRGLIKRARATAIVLTCLISFLLLLVIQLSSSAKILGLSKDTWLNVAGSVFATALFLFIESAVQAVKGVEESVEKNAYREIVEEQGILEVFSQRGDDRVLALYERLISDAESRIWAIGMTNGHFVHQHLQEICARLHRQPLDVVIAFWDPDTTVSRPTAPGSSSASVNLLSVQSQLEGKHISSDDLKQTVRVRQEQVQEAVDRIGTQLAGRVRIVDITHVANFTCLIVDDQVFFFPFLAGPDSTNNPTLRCSAQGQIGRAICRHVEHLLASPEHTRIFWEKDAS